MREQCTHYTWVQIELCAAAVEKAWTTNTFGKLYFY